MGLKGHLRSEKGTMVISTAHVSLRNIYALWQCVQAYGVRRIAFSGHSIAMHTINQDKNRNIYALWHCVHAYGVRRIAFSGHSIAMHTINQDKNVKWPMSGHVLAVD